MFCPFSGITCEVIGHYGADVGTLTIVGAQKAHSYVCVRGQVCEIADVAGPGLTGAACTGMITATTVTTFWGSNAKI